MLEIEYMPIDAATLVHPLEYEEMLSVQKEGIFDYIVQSIGTLNLQIGSLPKMMLEGFPVNEDTYPRLYRIYKETLRRLKCEEEFKLFVDFSYELTAKSYGSAQNGHLIVVNSACLKELNDGELYALLGREIGHIQNSHIQYREMIDSIHLVTDRISAAGRMVKEKASSFFSKWMIVSEFTADRAGLMACRSYEHMVSLLMRQMGVKPDQDNIKRILKQKTDVMPGKMGINYMIMSKAFTSVGMAARIKELDRWVNTKEFRNRYPFIHYMEKAYLQESSCDETEKMLILLHRRATNGNIAAQVRLAEYYILGKETLPKAYEPYLALIQSAAYKGNAKAMYALFNAFEKNLDILKSSPRLRKQLLRAAESRNITVKEEVIVSSSEKLALLAEVVSEFANKYGNSAKCVINLSHTGKPLQGDIAVDTLDAFWMMAGDEIYAEDVEILNGDYYGVAISRYGIYGRFKGKRFPFTISWRDFSQEKLQLVCVDYQEYIACGKQRICRWEGKEGTKGTIGEIFLRLKQKI